MDVLSDVLRSVRLTGALFFDFRVSAPLRSQTPNMKEVGHLVLPDAEHVIPFHIAERGGCWVKSIETDDPPVELREGDIVIYPHGHAHVFSSSPDIKTVPPNLELYRRVSGQTFPIMANFAEPGSQTLRFMCGYLGCDKAPFNPLLDALPAQIIARRPPEGSHIEVDLMSAALSESDTPRPGSEAILDRLSELLFVRAVRRYIEGLPQHSRGWLAGIRDPHVGRALELLHSDPARNWTLETLARKCGQSRAVFAENFARTIGETPMRYLARWRMQLATHYLANPYSTVEDVADRVGYRSEASFSRAFKSIVGQPPGMWRKMRTTEQNAQLAPRASA